MSATTKTAARSAEMEANKGNEDAFPTSGGESEYEHEISALRHLSWSLLRTHFASGLRSPAARLRFEEEGKRAFPQAGDLLFPVLQKEFASALFDELVGMEALLEVEEKEIDAPTSLSGQLSDLEDLSACITAARSAAPLSVIELDAVGDLLRAGVWFQYLEGEVEQRTGSKPKWREGLQSLRTKAWGREGLLLPRALHEALERSVEKGNVGEEPRIADAASEELREARIALKGAKRSLMTQAERALRRARVDRTLQDDYWTERDGRVVLPIRSDAMGKLSGQGVIIHGASASGQTLFVEPRSLVSVNNELRQAMLRVESEELRVRTELSAAVAAAGKELERLSVALERLDGIWARLELSRRLDGKRPKIVDASSSECIELLEARHPLMVLDGAEVVPNDLCLQSGHGLIISGPNAGGKTVALKTLGLCVLLARSGIRLPTANYARVPLFSHLVTDVGDDQSIAANLSTFSAHLEHVKEALRWSKQAPRSTLVLLDEVAVGTDPEQGAALAESIMLELVECGCTVVATTHYDRLKLLAVREEGRALGCFGNAAVGFDLERMRPTFRVTVGVPGSSSAIAVARRLGLPESVLGVAETLLGDEDLKVDVLLREIAAERQSLHEGNKKLEERERRVARREDAIVRRERKALDGARSRKHRAYEAARTELQELERELKKRRKELRRLGVDPSEMPTRADVADGARERLANHREVPKVEEGSAPRGLDVGEKVRVPSLGSEGEILAIKGNKATVQLPNLRTTLRIEDLRARDRKEESEGARPGKKTRGQRGQVAPVLKWDKSQAAKHFGDGARSVKTTIDNEIDLRGERVEDAFGLLEVFLSEAMGRGQEIVVVRHGHGSGALRQALREHLSRLDHVFRTRSGLSAEGGDTVTVVWLD